METWQRHFFYRKKSFRTTWKLRSGVLVVVLLTGALTSRLWTGQIGRSLVCAGDLAPSDVILIENFDPHYILFERAATLEKAGLAPRILVTVQASPDPGVANPVSAGIAQVMARQARMRVWEMILVRDAEPISLNAALQVRDHLVREQVKSLIIVTSALRSQRSMLVYRTVLGRGGPQVRCDPVFGLTTPERWTKTWHGIQGVTEEILKLQYYRFYVIPFRVQPS
jgi:hypothetical protein